MIDNCTKNVRHQYIFPLSAPSLYLKIMGCEKSGSSRTTPNKLQHCIHHCNEGNSYLFHVEGNTGWSNNDSVTLIPRPI